MEAPQVFRSGWAHLDQRRTTAWPGAGPWANRPADRRSGASAARGPLSERPTTRERCPPPPSRIRPQVPASVAVLMRQCRAAGAMSRTTASWNTGGTDGLLRAVSPAVQLWSRSWFQHGRRHLRGGRRSAE